jgi:hypothetical protein
VFKQILLVASCAVSLSAFGSTQTWDFSTFTETGSGNGNTYSGNGLTLSGWSNTGGSAQNIENGELDYANGYGLTLQNRDEGGSSPDHAIDSSNSANWKKDYDMVLLSFDEAINLAGFSLGWAKEGRNREADVTVLAYSGNDTPSLAGSNWGDVASAWSTEAQIDDANAYAYQSISSSASSKYWLIGAYNPIFGDMGYSIANDAFKLAGVKANSPQVPVTSVPEPGTVLMFAAGLFGIALRSRKRQA